MHWTVGVMRRETSFEPLGRRTAKAAPIQIPPSRACLTAHEPGLEKE